MQYENTLFFCCCCSFSSSASAFFHSLGNIACESVFVGAFFFISLFRFTPIHFSSNWFSKQLNVCVHVFVVYGIHCSFFFVDWMLFFLIAFFKWKWKNAKLPTFFSFIQRFFSVLFQSNGINRISNERISILDHSCDSREKYFNARKKKLRKLISWKQRAKNSITNRAQKKAEHANNSHRHISNIIDIFIGIRLIELRTA